MQRFILWLLIFISVMGAGYACSCVAGTPESYANHSDVVFSGTPVEIQDVSHDSGMGGPMIKVTFAVDTLYEGKNEENITVMTPSSSAGCGINFEKNQDYLIYAANREDGILQTGLCSGTKQLRYAEEDLKFLTDQDEGDTREVSVNYDRTNGKFTYDLEVELPTPCHKVEIEETILESYPAQLRIVLDIRSPDPDEFCAQVITKKQVNGTIPIDHRPGNYMIYLGNKTIAKGNLEDNQSSFTINEGDFTLSENEDGSVSYTLEIEYPTACYEGTITQKRVEKTMILNLETTEKDGMCAQVLTPKTYKGKLVNAQGVNTVRLEVGGEEITERSLLPPKTGEPQMSLFQELLTIFISWFS